MLDDATLAQLERSSQPQRATRANRTLGAVIIVLTVLTPVAEFVWLRLHVRAPTVIDSLGMPWPDPWSDVVQVLSAILIGLTAVAAVAGIIAGSRARVAGIVAIAVGVLATFPALVVTLVLTFGDPA